VQPEVAKFTRVCSYDRAGLGWSDTGPSPRTARQIVGELPTLLKNAGIPGPYVLVSHSAGGHNVRLFAHEYPQVPRVVLTAGNLGDTPPPGVSGEDFARWKALWQELQTDLASRCSNSVHLTVTNSTHLIPLDQPAAVVGAIRQVVEAARKKTALPQTAK